MGANVKLVARVRGKIDRNRKNIKEGTSPAGVEPLVDDLDVLLSEYRWEANRAQDLSNKLKKHQSHLLETNDQIRYKLELVEEQRRLLRAELDTAVANSNAVLRTLQPIAATAELQLEVQRQAGIIAAYAKILNDAPHTRFCRLKTVNEVCNCWKSKIQETIDANSQ